MIHSYYRDQLRTNAHALLCGLQGHPDDVLDDTALRLVCFRAARGQQGKATRLSITMKGALAELHGLDAPLHVGELTAILRGLVEESS